MESGTLSLCPCSDVPTNVFLRFESVFQRTRSHVRVQCSVSVFNKLPRRNRCPYFPNGKIKIEIKFRANATQAGTLNRFSPHLMFKSSGVWKSL